MPDRRPAPTGPRRRLDPSGPVIGVFFLVVAAVFMANGFGGRPVADLGLLVPALLVGLGVAGIVRVLTRSRRSK
ncbi:hypothetical protein [Actinomadura miaoliensis]|uniref:Uncharacterized protein n=1 Tax=Actinomadura miaoliensis TaxID=430685 RepID=A0ABP7VUR4_9ACTN